jgi:hypothetical protein
MGYLIQDDEKAITGSCNANALLAVIVILLRD